MTDDFLTQGLQEDRYLKALRLTEQFDSEIEARLRNVGERMIEQRPELFESNVTGNENSRHGSSYSEILAYTRINYPMNRVKSRDDAETLRLNVHLYWRDPTASNRTDVDGALRAFGYKVKGLSEEDDDRVVQASKDWALETALNPWDSSTVFYQHISSTGEFEQTAEKLVDHFAGFGDEFGVKPDS